MDDIEGAYSLVIMHPHQADRRPRSQRLPPAVHRRAARRRRHTPLPPSPARLDAVGAKFVRDVAARRDRHRRRRTACAASKRTAARPHSDLCVFEFIYFARPDSVIEGTSVHLARQKAGRVSGAGASGGGRRGHRRAGLRPGRRPGLCQAERHPLRHRLDQKQVHRPYLYPAHPEAAGERRAHQAQRHRLDTVRGKRVVLVDDSIVRGTTSPQIVKLLREAGAKEVHYAAFSAPPFLYPCYFGTDIDSRRKHLIAYRPYGGGDQPPASASDSLGYLSCRTCAAAGGSTASCGFCTGCFTGEYPVEPPHQSRWHRLDKTQDFRPEKTVAAGTARRGSRRIVMEKSYSESYARRGCGHHGRLHGR